jgi:hypothetical protein
MTVATFPLAQMLQREIAADCKYESVSRRIEHARPGTRLDATGIDNVVKAGPKA